MGTQIGELFVRIGADTKGLQKGFLNAELSTKNLKAGFDKIKAAAPYAVAAAAAVGAAMLVHIVKKTMAAVDAQAKLARQFNSTIEGMVTLQHAGALAGITAEQLNVSLRFLDKALGQAAVSTSAQAKALDRLGLSAKDLAEMDADERIAAIVDAVEDSVPATDQAKVLSDLLGDIGGKIKELDSEAIKDAAIEVEALGLAVSEVDARTLEEAGDAIYTLSQVFTGMANKITTKLGPVIKGIAVALKDWAVETRGFESTFEKVVNAVLWGAKWIANALWGLNAVWQGIKATVSIVTSGIIYGFAEMARSILTAVSKISKGINSLISAYNWIAGKEIVPKIDTSGIDDAAKSMENLRDASVSAAKDSAAAMMAAWSTTPWGDLMMDKINAGSGAGDLFKAPGTGGGTEAGGEGDGEETEAERIARERMEAIQAMRDSFQSEMDQQIYEHTVRQDTLEDALAAKQITQAEYNELERQEALDHAERMRQIRQDEVDAEVGISKRGWADQLKNQSRAMKDMLGNLRGNLDTLFGENKAYATAMAIIDGIQAIQSSYRFGANVGGPYMGAAMAAIAAAAVWKNVSDIQSTDIGSAKSKSKGGPGGPGGGGGPAASAPGQSAAPTSMGYATINIVGGDSATFTGSQVRALIEQINDEVGKGMTIRVA